MHQSRRAITSMFLMLEGVAMATQLAAAEPPHSEVRSRITIRGIYGGVPTQIFDRGKIPRRLWRQRHLDRFRIA